MRRNKKTSVYFIAILLLEKKSYCLKKSVIQLLESGSFSLRFYFAICTNSVMCILGISQWQSRRKQLGKWAFVFSAERLQLVALIVIIFLSILFLFASLELLLCVPLQIGTVFQQEISAL